MWKNYIKNLKKIPSDRLDYFNYFLESFPQHCKLLEKEVLLKKINNAKYDLFYQQMNVENMFYDGDISEIISIYYYYREIDWVENGINIYCNDSNKNFLYKSEFDNLEQNLLLNFLSFDFERLLSKDSNKIALSFLFLFFIPNSNLKNLLFNSIKKISLLSCSNITINNFKMLIYLTNNFDNNNFKKGCHGYNYNHQLIEDYAKSKNKELPLEKIFILLKFNCGFKTLESLRKFRNLYNLSTLYKDLIDIEIGFLSERLAKKLKTKVNNISYLVKI